ncbi:hypothetical protein CF326_g8449 [Tilletia indica]|nr:hypothetical protein CF326_g8449 [Tilletia indica]
MADAPPNHPDPVPGVTFGAAAHSTQTAITFLNNEHAEKKKKSRQQKRHIASLQRSLADQTALYEIAVQERAQAEDRAETQRRLAAVQGQAAVAAARAGDEAEAGREVAEELAAQLEAVLGRLRQQNAELQQQAAQVEPLLRAVARIGDDHEVVLAPHKRRRRRRRD